MINALNDLLPDDELRAGLLFGLLVTTGVALGAGVHRRAVPWVGAAFGVATVLGLAERFGVDVGFVGGLVLLAGGGLLTTRRHGLVRMAAMAPGALVFTRSTELHEPSWAMPTLLAVTLVSGVLVVEFDRPSGGASGLGPVLLAVSVLGVYATTPDTEHALVLVGVALPLAVLGGPWPVATLGGSGSLVVTALVSWTVVVDGMARPGAVVGGLACLGMLVVEPVVRVISRATAALEPAAHLRRLVLVTALHLGVVAVCSRVAGLRASAAQALVLSALVYAGAAAALLLSDLRDLSDTREAAGTGPDGHTVRRRRPWISSTRP